MEDEAERREGGGGKREEEGGGGKREEGREGERKWEEGRQVLKRKGEREALGRNSVFHISNALHESRIVSSCFPQLPGPLPPIVSGQGEVTPPFPSCP